MSSLYSVWDICDDLIFRKVRPLDLSRLSLKHTFGSSRARTGQRKRRERVCKALRGFISLLGSHMVHRFARLHDRRHSRQSSSASFELEGRPLTLRLIPHRTDRPGRVQTVLF